MENIANYFSVSLFTSTRTKFRLPTSTYYFSVEAMDKLDKVIYYFDKYPLMGVKSLDYQDFKTIYLMILNKDHLTDLGRDYIKAIVLNINSNRKESHYGKHKSSLIQSVSSLLEVSMKI
jgi:hypothetical protein